MEYKNPICPSCNVRVRPSNGKNKKGVQVFKSKCDKCAGRKTRDDRRYAYRKHKKDHCEKCGFIPVHPVQLDVDHIDGNKENDSLNNLQTLCANCHRLKTLLNNDFQLTKPISL